MFQRNKAIWMQNHVFSSMFSFLHNVIWLQIENHEFEIFESKYAFDLQLYLHEIREEIKSILM